MIMKKILLLTFIIFSIYTLHAQNITNNLPNSVDSLAIENQISIYPNPAKYFVNVKVPEKIKVDKVAIYDLLGKELKLEYTEISDQEYRIQLSSLEDGIYFIKFINGNRKIVKKLMIRR